MSGMIIIDQVKLSQNLKKYGKKSLVKTETNFNNN